MKNGIIKVKGSVGNESMLWAKSSKPANKWPTLHCGSAGALLGIHNHGGTIVVEGDVTEEHPKHFVKMKVIYEIYGNNVDRDKVEKAVELSAQKYCGVSHSYKKAMDIEYEIRILN